MRTLTLLEEGAAEEWPADELEPGDVLFVGRVGKRLVVERKGTRVFLDYPKRPRVIGSAASRETTGLVSADPEKSLGWVSLAGQCTVVGYSAEADESTDGEEATESGDLSNQDGADMRGLFDELLRVTDELDAIARRGGGRPITEHLRDARHDLSRVASGAELLTGSERAEDLRELVAKVRAAAGQLESDVRVGADPAALRRIIGAVQTYDDDF